MNGSPKAGSSLEFGALGLKSQEAAWLTSRQIEAARRAIVHKLNRGGQVWIRVFPDKSVTARPAETRMGGGKGAVDHWVAVVRRGRMMFEIGGVPIELAREALQSASHKLPVRTTIVSRENLV
jgi:large subunit ribosomal protein L16